MLTWQTTNIHLLTIWAQINTCNIFTVLDTEVNSELTSTATKVRSSRCEGHLLGPWSYGSWIYNYLCNQCLLPLKLWVWNSFMARCITLCDKVRQGRATCWWFSPGTPISSTNKTDCHYITEILLKVALSTINHNNFLGQSLYSYHYHLTNVRLEKFEMTYFSIMAIFATNHVVVGYKSTNLHLSPIKCEIDTHSSDFRLLLPYVPL